MSPHDMQPPICPPPPVHYELRPEPEPGPQLPRPGPSGLTLSLCPSAPADQHTKCRPLICVPRGPLHARGPSPRPSEKIGAPVGARFPKKPALAGAIKKTESNGQKGLVGHAFKPFPAFLGHFRAPSGRSPRCQCRRHSVDMLYCFGACVGLSTVLAQGHFYSDFLSLQSRPTTHDFLGSHCYIWHAHQRLVGCSSQACNHKFQEKGLLWVKL